MTLSRRPDQSRPPILWPKIISVYKPPYTVDYLDNADWTYIVHSINIRSFVHQMPHDTLVPVVGSPYQSRPAVLEKIKHVMYPFNT